MIFVFKSKTKEMSRFSIVSLVPYPPLSVRQADGRIAMHSVLYLVLDLGLPGGPAVQLAFASHCLLE